MQTEPPLDATDTGAGRADPLTDNAYSYRLTDVRKSFGDVVALDGVTLDIAPGEMHGLLGENGAGKTTLMNVLYGLVSPDSGSITVAGRAARFSTPRHAIAAGIGMVHQHFMLIPTMTVAENVLLGLDGAPFWSRRAHIEGRARELAQKFGIDLDVTRRVGSLPVGLQQRVEILKCLARDARLLVLDEPTAVLTPQEAQELGAVLRRLAESGRSVVFISHKLPEVLATCDRATVIRRGRNVATVDVAEADVSTLTKMMVGESVAAGINEIDVDREDAGARAAVLTVDDLHVLDDRGLPAVRGVSLTVRVGEIYGVAGVDGNGQHELMDALAGVRASTAGATSLDGRDITRASTRARVQMGLAVITDDRRLKGLSLALSVAENLVTKSYRARPVSRSGWLRPRVTARLAAAARDEYDIRVDDLDAPVSQLSGGNQQKVVIAREMSLARSALIAMSPTRGLDVAATAYVHRSLVRARDDGKAVLLISTDLDEILTLSDRVGVMLDGVIHEMPQDARSREDVGRHMVGAGAGS